MYLYTTEAGEGGRYWNNYAENNVCHWTKFTCAGDWVPVICAPWFYNLQ